MANPYDVRVPNALEAIMAGEQGYEGARKRIEANNLKAAYADVGQQVQNGGLSNSTLGQIMSLGPSGAPLLTAAAALGKADSTDEIKEYNLSKAQGFTGSFTDWKTNIKRAGANQHTINMPPQEKAYDAKMGGELAELNVGIIKGAGTARSNIATIDRLEQLLQDPNVYQGTAGEKVLQAKRLAKSIGIDVGEVGPAEAAQAITAQLALNARSPAGGAGMPGAMSDADREYLKSMQPGIERTPDGNRLIVDVNRKLNQRAVDVDKFRQDYVKKNGRLNEGFYRDLTEWSNKNPLFAGAPNSAAPSSPRGGQQGMPQGARQAPDGNFYVPDPQRPGKFLQVR